MRPFLELEMEDMPPGESLYQVSEFSESVKPRAGGSKAEGPPSLNLPLTSGFLRGQRWPRDCWAPQKPGEVIVQQKGTNSVKTHKLGK